MKFDDNYPSQADIKNVLECLPPFLPDLLQLLLPSDIARGSFKQSILEGLKPRSFIP